MLCSSGLQTSRVEEIAGGTKVRASDISQKIHSDGCCVMSPVVPTDSVTAK